MGTPQEVRIKKRLGNPQEGRENKNKNKLGDPQEISETKKQTWDILKRSGKKKRQKRGTPSRGRNKHVGNSQEGKPQKQNGGKSSRCQKKFGNSSRGQ